jgi:hypothetical protein
MYNNLLHRTEKSSMDSLSRKYTIFNNVVNSLTPKSVPAGAKKILFGRYVLNIYVGIVRYFSMQNENSAHQNLLTDTTHKSANIVQY